jgi:hypothetical protein
MRRTIKTADILAVFLLFAVLVTAFLARSPYSVPVPLRDSGIFLNIGSDILHGKILYQQTWDNKQPLLYAINALGLWLGGGSVWGVWGLELAFLLMVFYGSYRVVRSSLPPWSTFVVIAIAFFAVFPFMGGNYSEEYSLVFQVGILALLFGMYLPDRGKRSRPAAALMMGILMGLVFCIKQTYLDIPVSVLIFIVFLAWVEHERGSLWVRNILLVAAGFVLVNIPVFVYFQAHGALRDYMINAFLFNRYYSYQTILGRITSLLEMIKFVAAQPFFFCVVSLWLGIMILMIIKARQAYRRALDQLSPRRWSSLFTRANIEKVRGQLAQVDWQHAGPATLLFLGLLDFPIFFLTISLSGKLWTHYYIPFFVGIFLLLAGSLAYLYRVIGSPSKRMLLNSLLAAALVIGAFPSLHQVASNLITPAGDDARSLTAAYFKSATKPDDTILVWGWESGIYFMAQRQSPTRFALPFALYVNTPYLDEFTAILLKEVQAQPPAFIADLRDPGMPFIDGRPAATCLSGNQMTNQGMVDFLAYICAHYVEDRSFDTINIYKLRAP